MLFWLNFNLSTLTDVEKRKWGFACNVEKWKAYNLALLSVLISTLMVERRLVDKKFSTFSVDNFIVFKQDLLW